MKQVLSLRLEENLLKNLREIENYQEKLIEYIGFLVESKGEGPSMVGVFLTSTLSEKDIESPIYLVITMLGKGVSYSDIKKTIEIATEKNEESAIAVNMIVEKWDKIIKAFPMQSGFLRDTLSIELHKRSNYYQYQSKMRIKMEQLENEYPDLFYLFAEYVHANKPTYRNRGEYMFYIDEIHNHLKRIFGKDEYERIIRGFLKCGAANIYTHMAKKNFWVAMEFNKIGKKYLEEIREKRREEKSKRMEMEIEGHLFGLIRDFIDARGYKPYPKIIAVKEANKLFDNIDKLVRDNWILVEDGKYGITTYISPTSINIIESYALKMV